MEEIIQIIGQVVEFFYLNVESSNRVCCCWRYLHEMSSFFSGFPFLNGQLEQFETVEMTQ